MPPTGLPPSGRSLWRLRLRDALLLPFALLLVLGGVAIRAGARVLRRSAVVRAAEAVLARLPPWAILPLFLIPEAMSHVGGFYAAYLLAHKQFLTATAVVVLVKGVGLVIALWIYQACRPALMTIRWFARAHNWLDALRHGALGRIRPVWDRARALLRRLAYGGTITPGAPHSGRRFSAIRARLRSRLRALTIR